MLARRLIRTGMVAIAIVQAMACGGDDDDEPTGITGSFTLSVSPTPVNLTPGQSTYVTATLTPSGGFSGSVSLTISGTPTGVSAAATPAALSGTTVASRIDLTATGAAAIGSSTVTVTGTSGSQQATATFTLNIENPPDYSVSGPGAASIASGATGDVTLNINRSNFSGGVTLALVNPPGGITATFSPAPTTGNSAVMTVNVASTVAPALYALTIRATASGLTDRTTTLQLTVIPPVTASNNVEYQFCDGDAPGFFAYQDGGGSWQVVNGTTTAGITRYGFRVDAGRGGVMLVYPFTLEGQQRLRAVRGSRQAARRSAARLRTGATLVAPRVQAAVEAYETIVFYGSTTELSEDGIQSCAVFPPTKTIQGTVTGLATFQYSVLTLGDVTTIFEGGVNVNPVTFDGVARDQLVFLGSRLPSTGSAPDRGVIFRNLSIPDGGTLPAPIDFNGPASFVPAAATVTIAGAQGDRFEVYNHVHTASGPVRLWNDIAPSQISTRPWTGLPASQLAAGEFHDILVFASPAPNSPDIRVATKYVGPVSNQTLTFAPAVNPATISQLSAGAYPRLRFQGDLPAEYNKYVNFFVSPDEGNFMFLLATKAWLTASGMTAGYDLTMPDVAGLPGFPTASRLKQGENFVTTEASGFTSAGTFEPRPAIGVESRLSMRTRTVDVP